ncbi:MAG TPA: hypothetical protein VGC79_10145 [Polyangiaceae bacterium]
MEPTVNANPGPDVVSAEGEKAPVPKPDSLLSRAIELVRPSLDKLASPLLNLAGLVSLGAGVVAFLVSPNYFALSVWVEESHRVYPSRETRDLPLPLSYQDVPAARVWVEEIRIRNSGSQSIGTLDKIWTLSLSDPGATRMVLLNPPSSDPPSTLLKPRVASTPNALEFEVGVLQPGAKADLFVALIYSGEEHFGQMTVQTSLPGLDVQKSAPKYQHAAKILVPLAIGIFLLVGVPESLRRRAPTDSDRKQIRDHVHRELQELEGRLLARAGYARLAQYLLVYAVGSLLAATILAFAMGWILAFFF